jgi:NADPH:quinone reductase
MRAFALDSFGEDGSHREVDLPEPGDGQVRLKVLAASINPVDWKTGKGYVKDYLEHRFPLILGQDACGVVDAIGPGVDDLKKGDVVFGYHGQPFMGRGTHAEYVLASASTICHKPEAIEDVAAAALPLAGVTAMLCVEAVAPSAGQVVLIVGAAGGVGSFAVQMAASRGATVIGVARRVNHDYLRQMDATEMVDYTTTDVAEAVRAAHPDGIDAIIDLVNDQPAVITLTGLVRDGGIVASPNPTGAPMDDPRVKGVFIVADVNRERLRQLATWLDDGTLRLPEIRSYPFNHVHDALKESEGLHVRGKLVVTI